MLPRIALLKLAHKAGQLMGAAVEAEGGVAPLVTRRLRRRRFLWSQRSYPRLCRCHAHWHSIARDGTDYNVFFVPSRLGVGVSSECACECGYECTST